MLGILRGLAIRRIWPTLSSRRIWAPMPKRRGSHFWAGLGAWCRRRAGRGGLRRSGAVEQHHHAVAVFGGGARAVSTGKLWRPLSGSRKSSTETGSWTWTRVSTAGSMRPWTIARCTSPEVLSLKAHRRKGPWGCRRFFADLLDQLLGARAVLDEVADGADLEAVGGGELDELGQPRHGAVVVRSRRSPRRARARRCRQVAAGFGVAGADQHAARLGHDREDVPGLHDVGGLGVAGHRGLHGAAPGRRRRCRW